MGKYDALILPKAKHDVLSTLTPGERRFIDFIILGMGSSKEAFKWGNPEHASKTPSWIDKRSMATLRSEDGKRYMKQRREQLMEHFFGEKAIEEDSVDFDINSENFKEKAIGLMMKALEDESSEVHFDAVKLAFSKVIKDLEDKKVREDPPMRYLPETCNSCRYRKFVEEECIEE